MEETDFLFVDEDREAVESISKDKWEVLIVDDEVDIHRVTKMALGGVNFQNKGINFLSAYSGTEARKILLENRSIAVIFLDVVMEESDTGLKLVKYIREDIENKNVRIILRTGQPGNAPQNDVVLNYDINDYKTKTELTSERLFATMITSLRSYKDITTIEKLYKMCITDGLTGLITHSYFEFLLDKEIERAKRYKNPFSIVMFDVDHFKSFNDTYGHPVGDRVLKAISKTVKDLLRKVDVVARYGGEEFSIILPETDISGAMVISEKLRKAVEMLEFIHEGHPLKITISMGVAGFTDDSMLVSDIIKKADDAMYNSKTFGRNRVSLAD